MKRITDVNAVVSSVSLVVGILLACAAPASASVMIRCPVEADTYMLHGDIYYGYPDRTCARATSWMGGEALFRFDLSALDSLAAAAIQSATFKAYTGQGSGMMAHPMAPPGTTQQAQVLPLRPWDNEVHPHGLTYWTEAGRNDYAHGYIDGSTQDQTGLPNIYDPGDVGGVDPYYYEDWGLNPADLSTLMIHDGGPGVPEDWDGDPNNLNPNGWVEANLTDFVKAWLPGGELDIENNGIRIHDLGGWSDNPDPEFPDDYGWGWYFLTKDVNGVHGSGHPQHPGADFVPYLEVSLFPGTGYPGAGLDPIDVRPVPPPPPGLPEPGTMLLLGMGALPIVRGVRGRRTV